MATGILAIITWPDGSVLASYADFERQGFGGFKLAEAQEHRARKFAKWAAFKALCHPDVVKSMDSYDIERAVDSMIQKSGFKLSCVEISTSARAPDKEGE